MAEKNDIDIKMNQIAILNFILRHYKVHKSEFGLGRYSDLVTNTRYRIAITRISSHTLEIEWSRFTAPQILAIDGHCCV